MSQRLMRIEFKPRAVKDLDALDRPTARRVLEKIRGLEEDLAGDVKRLTNFTPEYRLRVGDYRVLFEIEGDRVIIASNTAAARIRERLMSKPELHPEILTKNGRKEFAVLPYEEYIALQEWLADVEDLLDLRAAKDAEQDAPTVSLTEVESRLDKTN